MLPLEHLYLEHVLQTVSVLEAVVLRSFGPEGGQVLFTRDTGQAMLTRSGTCILTALHLEHPLARMVVDCVWKHSTVTGDGSKTFIILLASLLRMIHATARKEPKASHSYNSTKTAEAATARYLANKLLAFGLKDLHSLIAQEVAPYGCCVTQGDFSAKQSSSLKDNHYVQKLVASFFQTRLSLTHSDFISDLTCELINKWILKNDPPSYSLQFLNDNFAALHTPVSGFPISCSRLIEGQVIHRDFATPLSQADHQSIKAVVFHGYLQPKLLNTGEVLQLGCGDRVMEERSIVHFSAWTERSLECVIAKLKTLCVSVLLSAVKQSAAVLALATQAQLCVVECVSEDELALFAKLSGATPVTDCHVIEPEHVATLTFCRPILLGPHRYVHVAFHHAIETFMVEPCSLVICAPVEGQTEQYTQTFRDAIRMLRTTLDPICATWTASQKTLESCDFSHTDSRTPSTIEPGCLIPAGGTFEFLLNRAIQNHCHSYTVSSDININFPVSQILATALLSIPQAIYSHNLRCFLQTQTRILSFISNDFHPFSLVYQPGHNSNSIHNEGPPEGGKLSLHCCRKGDVSSKLFVLDLGLESVSCKYQLLLAVLQCVTSLLQADTVLRTHTALHAQSHRLANSSTEDTEDEAGD